MCVFAACRGGGAGEGGGLIASMRMRLASGVSLVAPCSGVLRKRRKYRRCRCCYQEPRQLQIQICISKAGCFDRDEDGDDDADADADDHDVHAPDYDDFGKYDDNDVDVVACSCTG